MFLRMILGLMLVGACGTVLAQGMMSNLMSGKLVNPEVGAFAWYNLKDTTSGQEYFLRQAIVGQERVKRKDGYWLETELVPKIGFPSVYKMLLTGPASDPENVHRLLVREGGGMVQEVELGGQERAGGDPDVPRELVGKETIALPTGSIEAEHYTLQDGDGKTEIWLSDAVPPMGLVKMVTPQGELALQRFGTGGKDGASAIPTERSGEAQDEVKDRSDGEKPNKKASKKEAVEAEAEDNGTAEEVAPETAESGKTRTNFGARKRNER